jgi:hypothetical protein
MTKFGSHLFVFGRRNEVDLGHSFLFIFTDRLYSVVGVAAVSREPEWKGYSDEDNSWVKEDNLIGCLDTLQHYCFSKKIKLSEIQGIMGADTKNEKTFNLHNWVTEEQVLSKIKCLATMREYQTKLDIGIFKPRPTKDRLMILKYNVHCFIILYLKENKIGYIADGNNTCMSEELLQELIEFTKIKLIPIAYNQQTKIDHCGASGVCIALAFLRSYKIKMIPMKLETPSYVRRRIIGELHKEPSIATIREPIEAVHNGRPRWFKCHCGTKSFKNEKALIRHQAMKGCISRK